MSKRSRVSRKAASRNWPSGRPSWHPEWRELRFDGKVLRHFKHRAIAQELILTAFEEEHWAAVIDDPLPAWNGINPKRRLRDTVKNLNRGFAMHAIHFSVSADGESVRWERMA